MSLLQKCIDSGDSVVLKLNTLSRDLETVQIEVEDGSYTV